MIGKTLSVLLFVGLAMWLGGCVPLSPETQARIDRIGKENETLALKLTGLMDKVKHGEINPVDAFVAAEEIRAAIGKNRDELLKIQQEAGSGSLFHVLIGMFGRTALHAAGAAIPATGGPIPMVLNAILTALLGGSTTKKPAPVAPSA